MFHKLGEGSLLQTQPVCRNSTRELFPHGVNILLEYVTVAVI